VKWEERHRRWKKGDEEYERTAGSRLLNINVLNFFNY